jgi:hypothetical protein
LAGRRAIGEALARAGALHEKRGKSFRDTTGVLLISGTQRHFEKLGVPSGQFEVLVEHAGH